LTLGAMSVAAGNGELSITCVMGNLGNGESTGPWDLGVRLFHGFHHGHPYNQLPISQMLTGRRPIVIW
jgi:hypothetical protein